MIEASDLPVVLGILYFLATCWHFAYFGTILFEIVGLIKGNVKAFGKGHGLRQELWWVEVHIAFPILILVFLVTADSFWDRISTMVNVMIWLDWLINHDDDDVWKKRRKKAVAKVKEVAGKLVVVPEPVPA